MRGEEVSGVFKGRGLPSFLKKFEIFLTRDMYEVTLYEFRLG
jgi:hypothetical protein